MGPMDLDRFTDFLPGGRSLTRLVDWVRNYVGFEFDWEVQLVLARDEVPGHPPGPRRPPGVDDVARAPGAPPRTPTT